MRLTADFSSETMEKRRWYYDIFNVLGEKTQPRILGVRSPWQQLMTTLSPPQLLGVPSGLLLSAVLRRRAWEVSDLTPWGTIERTTSKI